MSTSFFKFPSSSILLIKEFYLNTDESQDKHIRLYTEVWYAENSCLSLKHRVSISTEKGLHKFAIKWMCWKLMPVFRWRRNNTVLTSDDLSLFLDSLITNHENQVPAQPEDQNSDETNMPTDEQKTTHTVKSGWTYHSSMGWQKR